MVRQHSTIEKKLKEVNKEIFTLLQGSYWTRRYYSERIKELKIQSKTLVWALNKIDHDPRGNRYHA